MSWVPRFLVQNLLLGSNSALVVVLVSLPFLLCRLLHILLKRRYHWATADTLSTNLATISRQRSLLQPPKLLHSVGERAQFCMCRAHARRRSGRLVLLRWPFDGMFDGMLLRGSSCSDWLRWDDQRRRLNLGSTDRHSWRRAVRYRLGRRVIVAGQA